ncbi:hypothetical protein [Nonomuraea sp. JJY05]|uniref:hypothetical protein n=1 Tax=Nonomuraea sp. JJY05 TaxID=3350255 RepID=UPI00373F9C11
MAWNARDRSLSRLPAEGIAEAPGDAGPLEAIAAGLERASLAMGPMNRELAGYVLAALAELRAASASLG